MSDRTYAQIHVYSCPEDQRQALLDVLADELQIGEVDWGSLPVSLSDDQVRCGTISAHAEEWAEAAPGASWVAWEDPAYDWLGTAAYCANGKVALFDCDAEGTPLVTFGATRKAGASDYVLAKLFPGYWLIDQLDALRRELQMPGQAS